MASAFPELLRRHKFSVVAPSLLAPHVTSKEKKFMPVKNPQFIAGPPMARAR